jgi:hypothetical protein
MCRHESGVDELKRNTPRCLDSHTDAHFISCRALTRKDSMLCELEKHRVPRDVETRSPTDAHHHPPHTTAATTTTTTTTKRNHTAVTCSYFLLSAGIVYDIAVQPPATGKVSVLSIAITPRGGGVLSTANHSILCEWCWCALYRHHSILCKWCWVWGG